MQSRLLAPTRLKIALLGAIALGAFTGAASAGALPSPVQNGVSDLAGSVGLLAPDARRNPVPLGTTPIKTADDNGPVADKDDAEVGQKDDAQIGQKDVSQQAQQDEGQAGQQDEGQQGQQEDGQAGQQDEGQQGQQDGGEQGGSDGGQQGQNEG